MRNRPSWLILFAGTSALGLLVACAENGAANLGDGSGDEDYPPTNIRMVAAGDPGGGLDVLARQIQQTLDETGLAESTINIENIGGGSGNPAMAIAAQQSDAGDVLVINSNRVYLNPITGNSDLTVDEDFSPIAQLMTEYVVLAVRDDSVYESGTEVMEDLQQNPRALTVGVGTVPSNDQLHILQVAEEYDVDTDEVNIAAFSAGGDLMTQLLGGHVDVISTGLSEALPQIESGDVRALAISAPDRVEGPGSDIPTWEEQGVDDLVIEHWRGVFGPPEMSDEARKYWKDTFTQMTESEQWEDVLAQNGWSPSLRTGEEFGEALADEEQRATTLLSEVGLVDQ